MTSLANDVLVLMPCGGQKLDRAARLLDLYTGPMWATLRTHLGAIPKRNVFVLSAKLGLRCALEVAEPYDQRMTADRADVLISRGIDGCEMMRRGKYNVPMGPTPICELSSGRYDGEGYDRPFRAVINAGAGEYRRVLDVYIAQAKAVGLIAADAPVFHVAGGIGEQRGQLGAFLRDVQAPVVEPIAAAVEVEAVEPAAARTDRTLTDREVAWMRTGGRIVFARATLHLVGDRFEMTGPSGTHSLDAAATDVARLDAHWQAFATHPLNAPDDPAPPAAPVAPAPVKHPAAHADGLVVIAVYRDLIGGGGRYLGDCHFKPGVGWRFHPDVEGKRSSPVRPTWEATLPGWTGGLDGTRSHYVRFWRGRRLRLDLRGVAAPVLEPEGASA